LRFWSFLADLRRNRTGAVPRPRFVTWAVTLRCNATCGNCDSWRLPALEELTVEQAGTIFQDLGHLDVVRLTGGEPTLRADLAALADAVYRASRPAMLHLTTHGGFPDRVLSFAEGYPGPRRLRILVSLDGLEEEHDRNRGHAVLFARAAETVRRLTGLRKRGVKVSVNHTIISPQSMADAQGLRARFARMGVDVLPVLAYETSATYGLSWQGRKAEPLIVRNGYPLHPALDAAEAQVFVERAVADLGFLRDRGTRFVKEYYLRGLLARLRGDPEPRPRPRCVSLRSHLRLLPDGSVPVCQFNGERIGRLSTDSIEAVWHGRLAEQSRVWVDRCPGCWAECEVLPNAVYSGDIFSAKADWLFSRHSTRHRRPRERLELNAASRRASPEPSSRPSSW
jgi:Fe-coproporphyrin III synthase